MSGQATINVVDDEDMSSQGSVNAPVAPQQPSVQQGPTAMQPTEVVGTPVQWHPTMTQQSGVAGRSGSPAPTVPVQSTQVVAAPTVPVDAPSRAETKQAFDEVSSVLRTVSSEHAEVRSEMQGLASKWKTSASSGRRRRDNGPSTSDSAADIIRVEFARGAYGTH